MAARSYNGRNIYTPNIDSAAGDVALTGSGYLESNSAFGWYIIRNAANVSAEFDSAVTRTGRLTLKLSTTDATGRLTARQAIGGGTLLAADIPLTIPVKPLRQYTLNVYVKTNNVAGATMGVALYNPQLVRTYTTGASISGTNDWTLKTVTFTTKVSDIYLLLDMSNATAGNVSDMWIDVNSIELLEVLPARTLATSRTTATNRVAVRDMGTALRFDGSGDYVNCGDIGDPLLGSLSVSGFFNANTGKGGRLVGKRDAITGTEQGYDLTLNTNGTFRTYVGDGTVGSDTNNISASHNTGIWKHFAYVIDRGNNLKILYINGVAISSVSIAAVTGSINYAGNLFIGATRTGAPTNPFTGLIDEPRIWNRALSATEIKNLYLHDAVPRNGLVGEYIFDEGAGTTAIDSSGNGNDGTITGATYTTDTPLRPRTSV